jgi:glycosyltransferase involved in cell wall biosynthesis
MNISNMKIAFDHQVLGWHQYGGISRYIYELASEITNISTHDLSVVSPLYVNQYLKQASKPLKVLGVPIKYIPRTGRIIRAVNFIVAWSILRFLRPDIVHETYFSTVRIAPKKSKVVLTVYDMIHELFSEQMSVIDPPTSRKKELAVARADHIICISEQTRQDLIRMFGVKPEKVSVVYLGFSKFSQLPVEVDIKTSRPFLLYVGGRGAYKNFESLLKAYVASSLLKNNFDLICFGSGAFSDSEVDLFQQYEVPLNQVHQVSGDDAVLGGYYQAASAFVYPSLYEGFGIPPLEAMSFDCPVVCSNVSSIPEVVGNAGEMFDPYDIGSIQAAIERVVSDSSLRKTLIDKGRERIKLFTWERCAQETLNVYHKVLA